MGSEGSAKTLKGVSQILTNESHQKLVFLSLRLTDLRQCRFCVGVDKRVGSNLRSDGIECPSHCFVHGLLASTTSKSPIVLSQHLRQCLQRLIVSGEEVDRLIDSCNPSLIDGCSERRSEAAVQTCPLKESTIWRNWSRLYHLPKPVRDVLDVPHDVRCGRVRLGLQDQTETSRSR